MVEDTIYDDGFEVDNEPLDFDSIDEDENIDRPHLAIKNQSPLFQTLFMDAVQDDRILESFAQHVVGNLSEHFATKAAKGGAFFAAREEEGKVKNTERFQHDQNLRAHLINGILPVIRIVRNLVKWEAPYFEDWQADLHERLLIAGYVLHDYTKIEAVKQTLRDKGFKDYDAPNEEQMPLLRDIFTSWCQKLGLDVFLGGAEPYIETLIYIACNTQALKGTARSPHLYSEFKLDIDTLDLVTYLSRLADLLAYVAKTPRDAVSHPTVTRLMALKIAPDEKRRKPIARLTYHHVAENRGLLLNFIHDAVTNAIADEKRIPLLFAPSGVVYLEHSDAPSIPDIDSLIDETVKDIRRKIAEKTLETGIGSQLNKDGLRVGDTFRDLFDLKDIVANSYRLVTQINSNIPKYMQYLENSDWPHTDNLPPYSKEKSDTRLRQMAEWASLVETQFEERYPDAVNDYIDFVFERWQIEDLREQFEDLRPFQQQGVGIRHRWYWVAAHALVDKAMSPEAVLEGLRDLSQELAQSLSNQDLPHTTRANQETWDELRNYIKQILSIRDEKSASLVPADELSHYIEAKVKRGRSTCAICGSDYSMRDQIASAVGFQPGVYTQRVRIGASNNKRSLCTICATEQLLRQLFITVDNLPTGKDLEAQNIRYLSFYPAYFYSPETLYSIRRAYKQLHALRLSDRDFWQLLRQQDDLMDATFWQRIDQFWMRPDVIDEEKKFEKVLRYDYEKQSFPTFFTVGFRAGFRDITETESWIVPTLIAFVMSLCLDVKVVVSDNDIPLMHESTELPDTLWFDGLHSSLQQLISVRHFPKEWRDDDKRYREAYNTIQPRSKSDVDTMMLALARVVAAYLIHLDSEYSPPKENWQRFTPLVNALCDSPLYVFHYLKKQERDGKIITQGKIKRYINYAENLFNIQGDFMLDYAKELAELYWQFYRVNKINQASSYARLRPIDIIARTLLEANQDLFPSEQALIGLACGELRTRLDSSESQAFIAKGKDADRGIEKFCEFFVKDIFIGIFNRDIGALRGKQLNLLRNACEYYYVKFVNEKWDEHRNSQD